MRSQSPSPRVWLSLLTVRGILLWLIVPISFLVWIVGALWLIPKGATLGRFLGWVDSNFVLVIERTLLRPFFVERTHPWVYFSDISSVTHRISRLDFV